MKTLTRRDFLKLTGVSALGVSAAAFLAGCGSDSSDSNQEAGSSSTTPVVFTMAASGDPPSLSPYGMEGPRIVPCDMLYEYLAAPLRDGSMQNWLAKSIVDNGDLTRTVEIYDYITDSQGNKVTADDVVFSFEKYVEDGTGAPYITCFDHCEALDDTHIKFYLKSNNAGGFDLMMFKVRIITQAAWEASGDSMANNPIGTSAYVLSEHAAGANITYTKREDYWQTDESLRHPWAAANMDTVVISIITDTSTQAMALEAGEIDASAYLGTADLSRFVDMETFEPYDGYSIQWDPFMCLYHLVFNCSEKSVCQNINLRKAIAYCIDREAVAKVYWGSVGIAATGDVHPSCLDFDPDYAAANPYYEYNPDLAKEYLEKAGYNNEPIRFVYGTSLGQDKAGALVASYMDAIGINVEVMACDNALVTEYHNDNTGENYDMEMYGATSYSGNSYESMTEFDNNSYTNGINHCLVDDPKLQELYEACADADTAGYESCNAMQAYLREQCYATALYTRSKATVALDTVELYTSYLGNIVGGACKKTV